MNSETPETPIKSWVRVKAFVLSVVSLVGFAQALSLVPWDAPKPVLGGLAIALLAMNFIWDLSCENCGVSPKDAVMALGKYYGEEREEKRRVLRKKGNTFSTFKGNCIHCGQERI